MEKNLVTKEEFLSWLSDHAAQSERVDILIKAGLQIWDSPLIEYGNKMFELLVKSNFTEEGSDWIFWWLYEKDGNPDIKAWDEDHDEIPLETAEDLWRFVKQYRKQWNSPSTQTSLSERE